MADVGILGDDAVRGDPGMIGRVATKLEDTASDLGKIRGALTSDSLQGAWEGAAAEAFNDLVDDLPKDLKKAYRSFDEAAEAMRGFSGKLSRTNDRAKYLARRLEEAKGRAAAADAERQRASAAANEAMRVSTGLVDPAAKQQAMTNLQNTSSWASRAQDHFVAVNNDIAQIKREAHENRKDLDRAAREAKQALQSASHHGIRNSVGSSFGRHVGDPVSAGAGAAWTFTKELTAKAWDLGDAFLDLVDAIVEGDGVRALRELSRVLEDLAAALTIVAVVVAIAALVVATVGTGGAAGAAFAAAVPGIMSFIGTAQVYVAGAKLGTDSTRMAIHLATDNDDDISMVDLVSDAASLGFAAAGTRIGGSSTKSYSDALGNAARLDHQIATEIAAPGMMGTTPFLRVTPTLVQRPSLTAMQGGFIQAQHQAVGAGGRMVLETGGGYVVDTGTSMATDYGNAMLPRPFGRPEPILGLSPQPVAPPSFSVRRIFESPIFNPQPAVAPQ